MQKLIFTNKKGDSVDLTSGFFGITKWSGFSNVNQTNQTQTVPFVDGSVYLDSLLNERALTVTLAINDENDLYKRYELRRMLIKILNPKLGEGYLIYKNNFTEKRIKVIAQTPIFPDHNSNTKGTYKANLTWIACDPYWEDLEETEVIFSIGDLCTINNNGDVPVQFEMEFISEDVSNPCIIRASDKKKIKLTGDYNNSIYINTNFGQKAIVKENLKFSLLEGSQGITDFVYNNVLEKYFAIGTGIYTSIDDYKWELTEFNSGSFSFGNSICYSENLNLMVAVGNNGTIKTSTDGVNWTIQNSGITNNLEKIRYIVEKNIFVAIGENKTILTSTDAINWTLRMNASQNILKDIVYDSSLDKIIIVGFDYSASPNVGLCLSSSDGINWDSVTVEKYLYGVCYSDDYNMLVAVGYDLSILTSTNGVDWTLQNTEEYSGILESVCYNKHLKKFFAVGHNNSGVGIHYESTNGVDWINKIVGGEPLYTITHYEDSNIMLCGGASSFISVYSNYNWIEVNINKFNDYISAIIFDKKTKRYIIIGYYSQKVYFGNNLKNWVGYSLPMPSDESPKDILYNEMADFYIICGQNGVIITSIDGQSWDLQTTNIQYTLTSIAFSPKLQLYVVVGENGTIITSTDGIVWTPKISGVTNNLSKIIWCDDLEKFFIVGSSGTILSSDNGIDWDSVQSDTTATLTSIVYAKNQRTLVTVGNIQNGGIVLKSINGTSWSSSNVNTPHNITSIAYSDLNNLYCLVTSYGEVYSSTNESEWSNNKTNTTEELNCIVFSDKFVFCGNDGIIGISQVMKGENIIQNLSEDSDIGLNLLQGENTFYLTKTDGYLNCHIKYRQKYIGV